MYVDWIHFPYAIRGSATDTRHNVNITSKFFKIPKH